MLGNISPIPTRMKLNLKKPLIVFVLETTGLDLVKDRIIQMSYIKVNTDGSEVRKNLYVNPCKTSSPPMGENVSKSMPMMR